MASRGSVALVFVLLTLLFLLATRRRDRQSWASVTRFNPNLDDEVYSMRAFKADKGRTLGPLRRTRAMASSSFVFHEDVWMTVVKDFERILAREGIDTTTSLRVYSGPFPYGFGPVVPVAGLYHNEVLDPKEFFNDVGSLEIDGKLAEVIMLGTCVIDLREWSDKLIELWDARPDDQKFLLICTAHHVDSLEHWEKHLTKWVTRKAIRLLTISEHVAVTYREKLASLADSADSATFKAGYADVIVDTHVPILDLPRPPPGTRNQKHILSDVVLQGSIETDRRDYVRILADLKAELALDPAFWGYLPLDPAEGDSPVYRTDPQAVNPPFTFHIIGRTTGLAITDLVHPSMFGTVVKHYRDFEYLEYYRVMQSMQLCLTSFAGDIYYTKQASSTFAMSLQCEVPLLMTPRTLRSYVYTSHDSITHVVRPQNETEVKAIKRLRAGPRKAWVRNDEQAWKKFKIGVWQSNARVVRGFLADELSF